LTVSFKPSEAGIPSFSRKADASWVRLRAATSARDTDDADADADAEAEAEAGVGAGLAAARENVLTLSREEASSTEALKSRVALKLACLLEVLSGDQAADGSVSH
jgi:hypothetical protein